ncbi:beta-glucosidase BglX [Stutzerimonas kunmingensis]|uniref:Periplasmic beta-glucosidase n=2 Tax=Stutzerimonas stutzeri subgroup TaxID=578833 RepID=A0A0D7DYP6_STUST|nr:MULTISPECIES: beta-glucosidase BglX [Stutzerimonas stutzeri subgroup]RRU74785.1 beta-glucosidase BglX [Stutzerimonas xanthomarina]KIZ33381.1 beta-D-glucoside glucohydrolase [Stutzerimonas stutzeri]MCD1609082.1 beta-glucosidase BglX [Stutzerimonas kunmingensis]PNG01009.1 beta-glucosidase BglX [Stutzerimonas kunmingensis]UIP31503.1 beta-glucosidase BglX [Stutzerimonas kunmingensis]
MKRLLPFVLLASAMGSFASAAQPALPLDDRQALIETLLERMTLVEKIGQLRLISIGGDMPRERIVEEIAAGRIGATFNSVTRADNRPMQDAALRSRLGVPIFFAYDVIHGHRTIFPISLALASSWDLEAIALSGRVSAIEASADGLDLTFAPMVDITRDPRWGRTSEGFGEDPYLVSQIAGTLVRAYQGERLSAADSVMASVKHFALYGAVEGGRDYNVVDMSPQRMHQDYLPPYRAAVDAGAGGVMIALNTVNGMPASANRWLLRDLLRDDWGFRGLNISDHGAIDELLRHGVARDGREAARLAIEAGIDLSMHDSLYLQELPGLVERGEVPIELIDQAVGRVLGAKYDLGLFHDPHRRIGKAADDPVEVNAEIRLHRQAARQVARDSLVLLENRQQTLPLRKDATIALVGPLADSHVDMLGSWSAAGVAAQTVTLRQGLEAAVGDSGRVVHARGANVTDDPRLIEYLNFLNWDRPEVTQDPRLPQAMIDEAVRAAREANVIVAAVGESRGMSHESSSRTSLTLPASQQALLEALAATGKPLVVVLMNGRPLQLGWVKDNADAVLETWFAGTEGGHAIAEVLLGAHNPSGKLPISFPRSVGQIPTYYNHPRLGRPYVEGRPGNYTSQYFEEPNGALYPFGYGLSYTEFELAKPQLSRHQLKRGQILEVSVTVKNTGARAGATVVQLYLQDLVGSSVRPIKELKRFEKLMLEPGESRVVRFELGEDDLKFPDARLDYVAEPGEFEVQLGLDSRSVQSVRFELL